MQLDHIMIDIETTSTETDAAIISICALDFEIEFPRMGNSLLVRLDPVWTPGRRSEDTMKWWFDQDPKTRQVEFSGVISPWAAAESLKAFIEARPNHWVWAGPSTFDLSILKTFYRDHLRLPYPIFWRHERDLSTLKAFAREFGIDIGDEAKDFIGREEHNPHSDCIEQAREVQLIYRALGGRM